MDEAYLDRLKLYFEGNRHVSTLSVATLVLLFTLGGQPGANEVSTGPALSLFGLSLLISLIGMFLGGFLESIAQIYDGVPGRVCFAISALVFMAGALFTIVLPVLF